MTKTRLKIHYTQKYPDHKDKQQAMVDATVGEKNGSTYLLFKEVDAGTSTITDNMVKIKGGKVMIRRSGGLKSELHFDITKDYQTLYQTPYGELEIGIVTKQIITRLEEGEIYLKICYDMYVSGQRTSKNIYEVQMI